MVLKGFFSILRPQFQSLGNKQSTIVFKITKLLESSLLNLNYALRRGPEEG